MLPDAAAEPSKRRRKEYELGVESMTCLSGAAKNKTEKFSINSFPMCYVLKATHHLTSFSRKNLKKREIVPRLSVSLPLCVSPTNQWSFVAAGAPAATNKNNTAKSIAFLVRAFVSAAICSAAVLFCLSASDGRIRRAARRREPPVNPPASPSRSAPSSV